MDRKTVEGRPSKKRGALLALAGCLLSALFLAACPPIPGPSGERRETRSRFTVAGNYLYALDDRDLLRVFDISAPANPVSTNSVEIHWSGTTISSSGQYLFLQLCGGIFLYDISYPMSPSKIGILTAGKSCDPVAAEGQYAYVTFKSGAGCSGGGNMLAIVDTSAVRGALSSVAYPDPVASLALHGASGLGVDNGRLFTCDGEDGLKAFSVADPGTVALLDRVAAQRCTAVLPHNGTLIVSGLDGLYQYDYSAFPMTELSKL